MKSKYALATEDNTEMLLNAKTDDAIASVLMTLQSAIEHLVNTGRRGAVTGTS